MATIDSNDLKVGEVFKDGDSYYAVLKYDHIKKGRGQATIKVKVKNIETGSITILSYSNTQKVEAADVEKRSAQFLYADDENLNFMDSEDYSQFSFTIEETENAKDFLKEGTKVVTTYLNGNPVAMELPKSIELEVVDTQDAIAGNTATNALKDATMESGYVVQVPMFIKVGDKLKINTETGSYVSRANS